LARWLRGRAHAGQNLTPNLCLPSTALLKRIKHSPKLRRQAVCELKALTCDWVVKRKAVRMQKLTREAHLRARIFWRA
jgi:hypothetical protein